MTTAETTILTGDLVELFARHGVTATTSGNDPLPLIDPGAAWLVTRGHVDIVAMTIVREGATSDLQRTHLLRVPAGQFIFGFRAPPAGHKVLLLGYGSGEAQVSRLPVARLIHAAADPACGAETARRIDQWVTEISELCTGEVSPNGALNLRAETRCELDDGDCAQPQVGVLWVRPDRGAARFLGEQGPVAIRGDIFFPVSKDAWLTAEERCRLTTHLGEEVIASEAYWRGLDAFQDVVETVIDTQRTRAHEVAQRRLVEKSHAARSELAAAFTDLGSILRQRRHETVEATGAGSVLLAACRLIGRHLGVEVREPRQRHRAGDHLSPLERIAQVSHLGIRRVQLRDDWHRRDGGPLLAFRREDETPLALVPVSARAYVLHDPRAGTVTRVTPPVAAELERTAFMFYRCLPERGLKGGDLLRFAAHGVRRDLLTVFAVGALGGIMALVSPVAIGHVFDSVVPAAQRLQVFQITLGLVVAALATGAFHLTRNIALIRVQHRSGMGLQAAVWDRVVNLPARFFAKYSAGDLGIRAMGIDAIMEQASAATVTVVVSSLFSLFSVALLFYYSPSIAVVALGFVAVVLLLTVGAGLVQLRWQRELQELHGTMSGMLLQFMNGIGKIRIAAAEDRAFAQWAVRFARQTRLSLRTRRIANHLDVFNSAFPVITAMIIFLLVSGDGEGGGTDLSTGAFLAFMAAFTTLLFGMMRLGSTAVGMLQVIPIYDRLRPILEAVPEVDRTKADPGRLRGRIEVSNVTFRYDSDGPLVLHDFGFRAEPGEFVAIVGPSGSGKSTLLRILLGFEHPEAGTIAYDGFDAAGLDPAGLRRQLGVVLQDGALLPGDVFTNIVGSAVDLTLNDAWEAARLAGLDRDIEQMPMGMHTVITEGASTLSGGQRQRLMIARALVTRPRIVFFDEATSALDNPTQAIVTQSLDRLRATRIVIAHRLSTIERADRIYVLDQGRVVQVGTHDELVRKPGLYHDLVKRQIA
jgi:NHLM bacteriocin system ABC transporter ATP-binding protein